MACLPGASRGLQAAMETASSGTGPIPEGYGRTTLSFAEFCAIPAKDRIFYALGGSGMVCEKLDPANWKPTSGPERRALPLPGDSVDDTPMDWPAPGLAGNGPFAPTWDSLLNYECPEWYQDAKFGIWNHWSPQCVAEDGDWYARMLYMEDSPRGQFHRQHYGHPSVFGYKDICAQWTLLNWDPDALMTAYRKAGAKLFFALANHHDGFDTWNSRHHPWNAQNIGPHRDVIGTYAKAARDQGLRFGVTVHAARNWWWSQTAHGADRTGPLAGVPYDGRLTLADGKGQWWEGYDPQRLYNVKHPFNALPDSSYVRNFYDRTRDLIDQHDPDLLYFDNPLFPLGWAGMNLGAYYYNHSLRVRGGRLDVVANIKVVPDRLAKAAVADLESGLMSDIRPYPWQSETCIGSWHYNRAHFEKPGEYGGYLPTGQVIHWLADVVSKNGIFVLNIPGKPDGTIDAKEQHILDELGGWMAVNGEAIYATRPWKIFGEGPHAVKAGNAKGRSVSVLGPADIRFTRNKANTVVYAIFLGMPEREFGVKAFGSSAATNPGKILHVQLQGSDERLAWRQTPSELRVEPPKQPPVSTSAVALKIHLT